MSFYYFPVPQDRNLSPAITNPIGKLKYYTYQGSPMTIFVSAYFETRLKLKVCFYCLNAQQGQQLSHRVERLSCKIFFDCHKAN